MKRVVLLLALAACGDNDHIGPLVYTTPPTTPPGAKLILLRDPASTGTKITLDLVVGEAPQTGYSVGFDLPLDATKVTASSFAAADGLDVGSGMVAGGATISASGELVVALSQKATTSPADKTVPGGAKLLSFDLTLVDGAAPGVIFDGGATSAGMRDRSGTTVVDTPDVAIGKLEVTN